MRFLKKPVEVEAVMWNGNMTPAIEALVVGSTFKHLRQDAGKSYLIIPTPEGSMRVDVGEWIIKDENGSLYPCTQERFEAEYEAVIL